MKELICHIVILWLPSTVVCSFLQSFFLKQCFKVNHNMIIISHFIKKVPNECMFSLADVSGMVCLHFVDLSIICYFFSPFLFHIMSLFLIHPEMTPRTNKPYIHLRVRTICTVLIEMMKVN